MKPNCAVAVERAAAWASEKPGAWLSTCCANSLMVTVLGTRLPALSPSGQSRSLGVVSHRPRPQGMKLCLSPSCPRGSSEPDWGLLGPHWASQGALVGENPPINARDMRPYLPTYLHEPLPSSLGWEDPLEEAMAAHSSILSWEIPRTEEPGGPESTGCKEVDTTETAEHTHTRPLFPADLAEPLAVKEGPTLSC